VFISTSFVSLVGAGEDNSPCLEVVIRGTTVIHRSHVKGAVTAVGVMTYAREAGHISPAGGEAAKSGANPALSRNCDAPLRG